MTSRADIATAQPGESANGNSANMHRHTNQPMANLRNYTATRIWISLQAFATNEWQHRHAKGSTIFGIM